MPKSGDDKAKFEAEWELMHTPHSAVNEARNESGTVAPLIAGVNPEMIRALRELHRTFIDDEADQLYPNDPTEQAAYKQRTYEAMTRGLEELADERHRKRVLMRSIFGANLSRYQRWKERQGDPPDHFIAGDE